MNLFEELGKSEPDNLISGGKTEVLVRGITLAGGQGILKRGTLLARNENNLGVVFADGMVPSGILTDDRDTGSDSDGEGVIAEEYITGTYNPDAVIATEGTDVKKQTETLRKLGIFLEEVV